MNINPDLLVDNVAKLNERYDDIFQYVIEDDETIPAGSLVATNDNGNAIRLNPTHHRSRARYIGVAVPNVLPYKGGTVDVAKSGSFCFQLLDESEAKPENLGKMLYAAAYWVVSFNPILMTYQFIVGTATEFGRNEHGAYVRVRINLHTG